MLNYALESEQDDLILCYIEWYVISENLIPYIFSSHLWIIGAMFSTLPKDASEKGNIYYFSFLILENKGLSEFLD